MGASTSKRALAHVRDRVSAHVGSVNVSGRYHSLPRRIEDDYVLAGIVLGTGQGGNVTMAHSRHPGREGKPFAVKTFNLRRLSREARMVLQNEVNVFLRLDHPHVCRLYDIYESEDTLYMVMECLEGGELHSRLAARCKFSERDAANTTYQMLLAINYIHNMGIVHRDLKLENFLYDAKESDHLKLIDFGFSCVFEPNRKLKQCCGTLAYMAPEVILKEYTNKCDMWSLGVIVHILLVGYIPFPIRRDHEQTVLGILNCDRVFIAEMWQRVSASATNFVSRLLEQDPQQRLSASEAMEHPWIKERLQISSTSAFDISVVESLCRFASASRFRRACLHMMAISLTDEELSEVRGAFIELDQNKRGMVKLHELKAVLEQRFDISDSNCRNIFEALDTNNDDEINYTEFLAAMMASRIQVHDSLMRAAFQRFDTQNTGYITAEQMRQVLGEEAFEQQEVDELVKGVEFAPGQRITYDGFLNYLVSHDARETHQEAAAKIIDAQRRRMRRSNTSNRTHCSDPWEASVLSPKSLPSRSGAVSPSLGSTPASSITSGMAFSPHSVRPDPCQARPSCESGTGFGAQADGTSPKLSVPGPNTLDEGAGTSGRGSTAPGGTVGRCRTAPSGDTSTFASTTDLAAANPSTRPLLGGKAGASRSLSLKHTGMGSCTCTIA